MLRGGGTELSATCVLIASGVLSRHHRESLSVAVAAQGEVFANRPFSLDVELRTGERDLHSGTYGGVAPNALETLVRREMGGAYPLSVPLEVSVGVGRDWNGADH